MNLDQKVLSYELSQKLDNEGVEFEETQFYWCKTKNEEWEVRETEKHDSECFSTRIPCVPAPLLVEMLEVLPAVIEKTSDNGIAIYEFTLQRDSLKNSMVFYFYDAEDPIDSSYIGDFEEPNSANACGKMLLHLLENGHITLEDINTNL